MKVCDAHNDFPTKIKREEYFDYIKKCERNGVEVLVASIFTTEMHNPLSIICDIIPHIVGFKNQLNKIRVLCHIEDLGFLKDEADLQKIIELRPFSCGIVWNNDNVIATKNGLTKFGKHVVKKLVDNKILVDLAHANKKTFYDAVKIIKKYVYVSHVAFSSVCNSPRNIDDEQIKTIIESRGFIGLFLLKKYVGKSLNAHIAYAKFLGLGAENFIGIGTDFYGAKNEDFLPKYKSYNLLKLNVNQKILYQNFIDFLIRIGINEK